MTIDVSIMDCQHLTDALRVARTEVLYQAEYHETIAAETREKFRAYASDLEDLRERIIHAVANTL